MPNHKEIFVKKLLVFCLIVVLAVSMLALSACSRPNYMAMLSMSFNKVESFEYDVYQTPLMADGQSFVQTGADGKTAEVVRVKVGTYKVVYEAIKNEQTITLPNGKEYKVSTGAKVTTELCITEDASAGREAPDQNFKGDKLVSTVILNKAFSPVASYKQLTPGEGSSLAAQRGYTSYIHYDGKNSTLEKDGEKSDVKIKTSCYDNDSIYLLVRGSGSIFKDSQSNLSFSVIDNATASLRNFSVTPSSTLKVSVEAFDEPQDAMVVYAKSSAQYGSGFVATLYYAVDNYNMEGDAINVTKDKNTKFEDVVNHPLLQINEGAFSYELTGYSFNND